MPPPCSASRTGGHDRASSREFTRTAECRGYRSIHSTSFQTGAWSSALPPPMPLTHSHLLSPARRALPFDAAFSPPRRTDPARGTTICRRNHSPLRQCASRAPPRRRIGIWRGMGLRHHRGGVASTTPRYGVAPATHRRLPPSRRFPGPLDNACAARRTNPPQPTAPRCGRPSACAGARTELSVTERPQASAFAASVPLDESTPGGVSRRLRPCRQRSCSLVVQAET